MRNLTKTTTTSKLATKASPKKLQKRTSRVAKATKS